MAEIIEAITGLVLDVESSNIKSSTRIFAVILSVLTPSAAKKTNGLERRGSKLEHGRPHAPNAVLRRSYNERSACEESVISKLVNELTSKEILSADLFPHICEMKRDLLGTRKEKRKRQNG